MSSFMEEGPVQTPTSQMSASAMPMSASSASAMPEVEEIDNDSTSEITSAHQLSIDKGTQKLVIYTVGRGNPLHEGHMATIMMAITLAVQNNGIALILLGDGPKDTKGTIENPLDFPLKEEIIKQHIPRMYKPYYAIRKKTDLPIRDIEEFIEEKKNKGDSREPFVVHLTADKEGKGNEKSDSKKLEFINEGLKAKFKTSSYVIKPTEMGGEEMSATSIRKFAVNKSKGAFIHKYGGFYGEAMAGTVYDKIIESMKISSPKLKAKYQEGKRDAEELEEEEEGEVQRSSKRARLGNGTPNGGTRKLKNKRKGITRKRKNKNKRNGITKKRKPYKSISK